MPDWPMPDFGISLISVLLLSGIAFVAGFVDAIAGGGGLLNVPALLLAGLPPVSAIATNKLQGTFGVASSAFAFWRAGQIERKNAPLLFSTAFAGGVSGAMLAHLAPTAWLKLAVPVLLVGIALYMLSVPKLGDADARPRLSIRAYALSFGCAIGAYDGVFGPGGGTFFLITLIVVGGYTMMRAMAHTKLMNFASNLGALIFFALTGHVWGWLGLTMGLASAIGAYLGARAAMRFGGGLVRPLVVTVSIVMALRLVLDPEHPVGIWVRGMLN
jgi:uncharacterized protein